MKGKKIVMLVHDNRIDRRVLDEAQSLQEVGWELTVIAGPPPTPDYNWDEQCYPDIEIVRLPLDANLAKERCTTGINDSVGSINWGEIFNLYNLFIRVGKKYPADIYVAHDLPQLPVAINLARLTEAFVVYDTHELFPHQLTFGKKKRDNYKEIEDYLIQYADKVITVNESAAKFLALHYYIAEPEIILNSPSLNELDFPIEDQNLLRKNLNINQESKIILYQGGVGRSPNDVRNLEKLIYAMKFVENKDIKLVFMGPKGNDFDALIEWTKKENLFGTKFFYHDAVPQTQLLKHTISADVGIIPYPHIDFNSYFCTPNKLFEFLTVGLPILGNDSPELNRFIKNNKIGLTYSMKTVEEIAFAINDFFKKDISVFKKNGKELYLKYLWKSQGKKIQKIYDSLITKNPKNKGLISSSLVQIGNMLENKMYKLIETECNFILSRDEKNIFAKNYLALSKLRRGDISTSESIIKEAIKGNLTNEMLLDNLNYITEYMYRPELKPIELDKIEDYLIN